MAVTLLKLSTGLTSLEFEEADWGAVKDEISRRFGEITVSARGLDDVASFGGQQFRRSILDDEPHLMAETARGATMLEEIAAALGTDGEWVATPVCRGRPSS